MTAVLKLARLRNRYTNKTELQIRGSNKGAIICHSHGCRIRKSDDTQATTEKEIKLQSGVH
jgi:hypothetical protein